MSRLHKLIEEMRRQLLPYHHEHDAERGGERWAVDENEYLASWIAEQLVNCRQKNRCDRRRRCVYYSYGDLARRNYEICREVILRLESGEISCRFDADQSAGDCQQD